jgi:hypothetical protein
MMIIYIYIVVETYRNVHFIFCEHRSRVKEDVPKMSIECRLFEFILSF